MTHFSSEPSVSVFLQEIARCKDARHSQSPREQLVKKHLDIVLQEVRRFPRSSLTQGELIAEGGAALWRAAKQYDPSRGPFYALARTAVRNALLSASDLKNRENNRQGRPFGRRWKDRRSLEYRPTATSRCLEEVVPDPTAEDPALRLLAFEELVRQASRVQNVLHTVKLHAPRPYCHPVLVVHFRIDGTLQKRSSVRETASLLGIGSTTVHKALHSTWDVLEETDVLPGQEEAFAALLEDLQELEDLTQTTVHFNTGIKAA